MEYNEPKLTPELKAIVFEHIRCFMETDGSRFMNDYFREIGEPEKATLSEKCSKPGCEVCKNRA